MNETLQSELSLNSAYQNVRSAIESRGIGPDDTELLYGLVKPLELALRSVPEAPSGDTIADKIARLLWFKSHINGTDVSFVLEGVRDDDSLVRTIATSALRDLVNTPDTPTNQKQLFQMQRAVQDQSRRESSTLLSYLLGELATDLSRRLLLASRQVTTAPANPFIAGLPIRDDKFFFGREELLNELEGTYQRQGIKGVILFGGRRTGKTSLLFHIQRGALGDAFAPVFIDVQSAAGRTVLVPLVLRALAEKWPSVVDPLGRPTEDDAVDFSLLKKAVSGVIKNLNGKRLLLMFDEYEVLDSFFPDRASAARMQSLFENEPDLLGLFAGPRPLNEVRNRNLLTLLDTCKYIPITFLDPQDAERLIREPAQTLKFSDSAVARIQQLCGGHPFYIQLLCQSIFTLKGGVGVAEDADVEKTVRKLIANPPPHLVLTWQDLDGNDKLVAASLATIVGPDRGADAEDVINYLRKENFPRIPSKASVLKGLAALRRADLARKSDEASASHVFTMDFVRRWIADSRTVWDLLEERRADVLSRTAFFSRRLCASFIDLGLMVLVLALLFSWFFGGFLYPIIVAAYYTGLLLVSDRTVAMRLLRLRVVNEDGTQLKWWGSALFALFLTFPPVSFGLLAVAVQKASFWHLLVASTLLLVEVVHQLQVVFHRQHRGLYDRLARVLVIYEPSQR